MAVLAEDRAQERSPREVLMSKRTTDGTALQEQNLGRSIDGVEPPPEIPVIHVGRFSEGMEYFPKTQDKLHARRFSEGIEQLPETPDKLHLGRFSEGIEQLPETARKLRRGSFADGHKHVRRGAVTHGRHAVREGLLRPRGGARHHSGPPEQVTSKRCG
jgi:hypothetical protein